MFVQLLFSVTFALSCTMFELIIFEILGLMDSRFVACEDVCLCLERVDFFTSAIS